MRVYEMDDTCSGMHAHVERDDTCSGMRAYVERDDTCSDMRVDDPYVDGHR